MMNTANQARKTRCYNINRVISSVLVPIMIGLLTIAMTIVQLYIANQQREQDLFLANQTRMKDLEIAEQNHQQALFLASENQKDTILNDYLGFLVQFVEMNRHKSSNSSEAELIVQVKTFAIMDQLDAKRKTHIIKVLYKIGLIRRKWPTEQQKRDRLHISLRYANLAEIDLGTFSQGFLQFDFNGIGLIECVLTKASFRNLCINDANFASAQLEYADFTKTAINTYRCDIGESISFYGASLVGARFI
jgi:uncharacterized protein YjbI with pentapeptide repeats